MGQYISSPGHRAYCYAELAVSSLAVPRPSPVLIAPTHGWMARLRQKRVYNFELWSDQTKSVTRDPRFHLCPAGLLAPISHSLMSSTPRSRRHWQVQGGIWVETSEGDDFATRRTFTLEMMHFGAFSMANGTAVTGTHPPSALPTTLLATSTLFPLPPVQILTMPVS